MSIIDYIKRAYVDIWQIMTYSVRIARSVLNEYGNPTLRVYVPD